MDRSVLDEYRKFIPQIAYVLFAGFTLIADRVSSGKAIDGVTLVAVVVAVVQALAVVLPGNAVVKVVLSGVMTVAAAVTAAWSDGTITPAEWSVLAAAVLAWAAGGMVPNAPATALRSARTT